MARVRGLHGPALDELISSVEELTLRALRAVIRAVVKVLQADDVPSVDDAAVVPVVWAAHVEDTLLPAIGGAWAASATTASDGFGQAGQQVPALPSAVDYMAETRNRLVKVGDDLWQQIRAQLVEGLAAGEGVREFAARIEQMPGIGEARAERIARTEVMGASNAASLATARAFGATVMKEWLATDDERTRATHRAADGQTTPVNQQFAVGESLLLFPGDPTGPADEVVMCRCSLAYQVGDVMEEPLTAAAEVHTGAMVALIPSEADAARLAVEGGEPVDQLHTTLLYLGEAVDYSDDVRALIVGRIRSLVEDAARSDYTLPVVAEGFAVSLFNPPGMERTDDKDRDSCIVLGLSGENLGTVRGFVAETVREVESDSAAFTLPEQHEPWIPHITLIYTDDVEMAAGLTDRVGPVTFDRIRVAFGGENVDIPLIGVAEPPDDADEGVVVELPVEPVEVVAEEETVEPAVAELGFLPGEHWHAVMITEGVSTGYRMFTPGALTWREPPFAYHWQYQSGAHGGSPTTVQVGNVTRVERIGDEVHGWGTLDLGSPEGREYARRLVSGFARAVSIGLDESFRESDVEYVWPESVDLDGAEMLMGEPEELIITKGRIGELTAVSVPAQQEAVVEPSPELVAQFEVEEMPLVAGAVRSHDTPTTDVEWSGDANVVRLPSPLPVEVAREVYAWIDDARTEDGMIVKDACKFPHHEVTEDGMPGAANLNACEAVIAALHGARSEPDIPASDRRGVYDHVARHLRDAGRTPPEFADAGPSVVVAAGHTITIPDVPPAEWFAEPTDVTPLGALTVTDEGRVYGYLAPAGIAHRAYRDRRVEAPMGHVDYSRWMGGEAIVAGGARVVAGPITMDCGHMSPTASADPVVRMEHYDNTCSVVAQATVGENEHGVWIAGALLPGVTAEQVTRMLACRLSGDWAPHPERSGWREFVAALLVPVPGFPMARSAPSVRLRDGALVASTVPVRIEETPERESEPEPPVAETPGVDLRPVFERLARTVGRDYGSRMTAIRERVHRP